ncbi:polysaccharide deacetylase family protein [Phreatobacter stygius]|uniref:Chitooligosaccharide deacetylase n=1 Tax=Phreatobacter stygius TaxID=1940610 RepID=A0A4D7ASW9_9HYPH|nr:polysaccharide deacetylase family protein [Phreatobacter stygius]QCI64604.1 polysaccharide deacetylase [Phreatobacter stygius]
MRPELRLPYRASIDRPRLALAPGKLVAVWPVVNVENWRIDNPMPRQVLAAPTGAALQPDIANWAWHEYGMRVGFWRFMEAFERHAIRPTLSINGSVALDYPRIAAAARDAGWEFMGHGWHQVPTHRIDDQRAMIARTVETLSEFAGQPCVGWLGPGLTETLETADHLAEAGIRYIADWVVDDLPCRLATASGPVLTMPYSVELNDIPLVMIQHHRTGEFLERTLAQADRLIAEARSPGPLGGAKILSFAIHPYITGVPHRIGMIEDLLAELARRPEICFMQGHAIMDWYLASGDPT